MIITLPEKWGCSKLKIAATYENGPIFQYSGIQNIFSHLPFDIQPKMEYPYPWASTVQVLYYAAFIIFQ